MADSAPTRRVPPIGCRLAACCCLLAVSCSGGDPIHSYTIEPIRQSQPLTYKVPTEWTQATAGAFQFAVFTIGAGDHSAEASVSNAGGTLELNVNRWRGQVELAPVGLDELNQSLEDTEVDGNPARRIQIMGPEESIIGVIVPRDESNWFFKLKGPAELVAQEADRFDAFVQSVHFAE